MKEELKQFNINIEDIKEDNNLFDNIQKAIAEMNKYTLTNRFEVILNNNLIEFKEKCNDYRTIFGCRISYDNLDKDVSFIVREDRKPSYEKLEDRIQKAIEYIKNNFADPDYMRSRYSEQDVNTHIAEIPVTDIEKLLDILKGYEENK